MGKKYSKQIPIRIESLLQDELVQGDSWSLEFLNSLKRAFGRYNCLTARQFEVFEDIETRFGADRETYIADQEKRLQEARAKQEAWSKEYIGQKKETDAKLIAQWHINSREAGGTHYYGSLPNEILAGKLPNRKAWFKFVENTYAQALLREWYKEPKYAVDTPVKPRASATRPAPAPGFEWGLVIKDNAQFPQTHAKGSKIYMVMAFPAGKMIYVEERNLKLHRKLIK